MTDISEKFGLGVKAQFIPFSQSRNKNEAHKSLNWRITLTYKGRDVLTTDYSAGVAHCPAYKMKDKYQRSAAIAYEVEKGHMARPYFAGSSSFKRGEPILPVTDSVTHSLILDAGALDFATYEDWAADFGYGPDSRKGEACYRACLEIALNLRSAIGDAKLNELRDAFADY
jgi:hypothetical protein